ncbi:hypothetical protein ILUMI_19767, partial [Ignelater luminosus]
MLKYNFAILLFLLLLNNVKLWKTCDDTFCGKVRKSPEGYPRYVLDFASLDFNGNTLTGNLTKNGDLYFELWYTGVGTFNFYIRNRSKKPRQRPTLLNKRKKSEIRLVNQAADYYIFRHGNAKSFIYDDPFKVENYLDDKLVYIINKNDRLVLQANSSGDAVALDVFFPGATQAYGIPQRADNLPLRTTTAASDSDPYRLFNVNTGQYKVKSREALHSSVPVLFAHSQNQTAGIFWIGRAQTWVDISHYSNGINVFFMSENYDIGTAFFNGPTMEEVVKQNTYNHVEYPPPYFAFGYHQSRNSYLNENEVLDVVKQFDANNLPLESVWLDSSYTESKKYFTWDPIRFPNPIRLQNQLAIQNRSLVITIGPHIKTEEGYFVHDEATAKRFYIQNPDGSDYVWKCPAGHCSYLDHLNTNASKFYSSLFEMDTFKAENLHVFLDFNEPTVFENEDHENTLPPELIHRADKLSYRHREVHNAYNDDQTLSTLIGLVGEDVYNTRLETNDSNVYNTRRPFLTTRSHFRFYANGAAVFTGDNYASWDHLQISFPMCLSEALVGAQFCGANVGGSAGIPDDQLYQRWYQAAAWLPFYRGHFDADVPRREPYTYPENIQARVQKVLNQRYAHLPVWYTLYWESILTKASIIRPLFYQYPNEEATFKIDQQLLVGASILAAPIMKPNVIMTSIYLPGGESEIWYNIDDNYKALRGTGHKPLYVNMDSVPVFYRGGSIIARKDTPRLTAEATVNDPYTLYICLDINDMAEGTLYVDDYKTFLYLDRKFLYLRFIFEDNSLSSFKIIEDADYDGAAPITELVVINPPKDVIKVHLYGKSLSKQNPSITYSEDEN